MPEDLTLVYLTIALIIWVPLVYVVVLKYFGFNDYVMMFFVGSGLVFFLLAFFRILKEDFGGKIKLKEGEKK